jgi:hypothetical protein
VISVAGRILTYTNNLYSDHINFFLRAGWENLISPSSKAVNLSHAKTQRRKERRFKASHTDLTENADNGKTGKLENVLTQRRKDAKKGG